MITSVPATASAQTSDEVAAIPGAEPYVDPRDGRTKILLEVEYARKLMEKALATEERLAVSEEGHAEKDAVIRELTATVGQKDALLAEKDAAYKDGLDAVAKEINGFVASQRQKVVVTGFVAGLVGVGIGLLISD